MNADNGTVEDKVRAPQGKYVVCLWDCYPRMEPPLPEIVDTFDKEEDACSYARGKNDELQRKFYDKGGEQLTERDVLRLIFDGQGGRDRMMEPEYFVMDDKGMRIG